MKFNLRLLLAWTVIFAIWLSGCSAAEPPTFEITQPGQGNTFPSGYPVNVTMASRFNSGNYEFIRWEIYIDGIRVDHDDRVSVSIRELHRGINGLSNGVHWMYARAQAYSNGANQSRWLETTEVCYWVGDNAPGDFCQYRTIVQPSVAGTPSLQPFTVTPTATLIVITRPNTNTNSNNNSKPSASGCAAYADQNSCNLAGCSWNYGSCVVNP